MSAMGVKIDQFDVPVCNSFQAKIMNDQLCYEVDLNKYYDDNNIENQLKLGFHFLIDYNEDRQVTLDPNISETNVGLAKSVSSSDQIQHAFVYLNTIGKFLNIQQVQMCTIDAIYCNDSFCLLGKLFYLDSFTALTASLP